MPKTVKKETPQNVLTAAQFRQNNPPAKPAPRGVWLFWGEENFLKQRELQALRKKALPDENAAAFDHYLFTRDNYTPDALFSAVMAVPMMGDVKLVELYEYPFTELMQKKEDLSAFEKTLAAASESDDTLFLIYTTPENFDPVSGKKSGDGKSADDDKKSGGGKKSDEGRKSDSSKQSVWWKLIAQYGNMVEFAHETSQKLAGWVQKHFAADKIVAEPNECLFLMETVGHDMATLTGEIEKLCVYLHANGREKLERADITQVCPFNKEFGDFAFADAILDADTEKAFWILAEYRRTNAAAIVILGGITKIFMDMTALKFCAAAGISSDEAAKRIGLHPYVAKLRLAKAKLIERQALEEILALCAETDAALKSTSADEYVLLERLIATASTIRKRKVFL